MIIYTQQDRIKISIHEVDLIVKPLSYKEKINWSNCITNSGGSQNENALTGLGLLLKFSLKEIHGITYSDGTAFTLEFDEANNLTDECIDNLMNLEMTTDLITVMYSLLKGIPTEMKDASGNLIDYIKIVPMPSIPKKK